jgi:hypothetical protein
VYFLGAQNSTYSDYYTGSYGHFGRYFWLPNVLTMDVTGKASRKKGACNTASSPPNVYPTDEADAHQFT